MKIQITTFNDIEEFVKICSRFGGDVDVKNKQYLVNGKSIIALLSLDYTQDVYVEIHKEGCTVEELEILETSLRKFEKND